MIDSHCHIDAPEFDADRDRVLQDARVAGVTGIVVPAVERANFAAVASVCRDHLWCHAAYGIHPMYVDRAQDDDIDFLRETLAREAVVAVGEIGLDRFVEPRDDQNQERFFVAQLKIAREMGLPVVLHVRRAIDLVLKHLRQIRVSGGIAHAFNGSRQQADEFIKLGFKLGFGGAMTFERAHRIRELAATLPLTSIVVETDAPDIPPAWMAGERNSPIQLPRIIDSLASLRGISREAATLATTENVYAVLPRLPKLQLPRLNISGTGTHTVH